MHKASILSLPLQSYQVISGVARVQAPGGQKIFLRLHQQKLQSMKRKIRTKARKKKQNINLLCVTSVIFRITKNKVRSMLETHSTKTTAVSESKKERSGLGAPSRRRPTGVRGAAILQLFSKILTFKHVLV